MKIKLIIVFMVVAMTACATVSGNHAGPDEKLNAENRLMKSKLNLALRENKVLKEENLQDRDENARLKKEVEDLKDGIDSLNRKYDTDMAGMKERYNSLNRKYDRDMAGMKEQYDALNRKYDTDMAGMKEQYDTLNRRYDADMAGMKERYDTLNRRYDTDMAGMKEQYDALNRRYDADMAGMKKQYVELEERSDKRLQELTDLNRNLEKGMNSEALLRIENLKQEIDRYKAAFGDMNERDGLPAEPSQKAQAETIDQGNAAETAGDGGIQDQPPSEPAAVGTPAPEAADSKTP